MIDLLRENLSAQGNLQIVPSTIEDYPGQLDRYDFALAANVLNGLERLDEVLEAVAARSRCLVISTWDVKVPPPWQMAVETTVLGSQRRQARGPSNEDMLAVLTELDLTYDIPQVGQPQFGFDRSEALLGWVAGWLDVPDEALPRLPTAWRAIGPHSRCSPKAVF